MDGVESKKTPRALNNREKKIKPTKVSRRRRTGVRLSEIKRAAKEQCAEPSFEQKSCRSDQKKTRVRVKFHSSAWNKSASHKRRHAISVKKVKVADTRIQSVGFRSWSRILAVSPQVTWVINPVVGWHYIPPGLQLPPKLLRGLLPILLHDKMEANNLKQKEAIRQVRELGLICVLI